MWDKDYNFGFGYKNVFGVDLFLSLISAKLVLLTVVSGHT